MLETAKSFFEACETGQGWAACAPYCADGATFSAQSDALADINSLEGYADWMKGILGPIPDGHYELTGFAADPERQTVIATAVFIGTNTGDGPVPATGKQIASDYAYVMNFDGAKISHMTKIWNDAQALKQLGWA
ncbi:MAG: nuclear transport factor 2 family protein [Pseudomonadota bacterium]